MLVRRSPLRLLLVGMLAALAFPVFASPAAAVTLPQNLGALGDSLTTAWGADGGPVDSPRYSFATGDDLRAEGLGFSHLTRLRTMNGSIDGYNFAQAGKKIGTIPGQIASLPGNVEYVTVTVGSSDVCMGTRPTGFRLFRTRANEFMTELKNHLGNANVVMSAVPNWYGVWSKFKSDSVMLARWANGGTCPRLLGVGATAEQRTQIDNYTRGYNGILASACSLANSAQFKCFFAGRVFNLDWSRNDFSTYDGFHPSAAGQAKLSQAVWSASPYRLAAWGLRFNRRLTFNRSTKNLRLNLSTAPHAHVVVRVTDRHRRALGSAAYDANGAGAVGAALHVAGWSGQSRIRVKFTITVNDEKMVVKRKLAV